MTKVLIVDDAKFMRVTLSTMLRNENYEVVGEAENGKEAIMLYKELKPDIVTMDITMPIMNGIDAIKAIINHDPNAIIIVCSAMGQQKVVVESIEIGASDFIIKPFDESRVIDTIKRVLHKSESQLI